MRQEPVQRNGEAMAGSARDCTAGKSYFSGIAASASTISRFGRCVGMNTSWLIIRKPGCGLWILAAVVPTVARNWNSKRLAPACLDQAWTPSAGLLPALELQTSVAKYVDKRSHLRLTIETQGLAILSCGRRSASFLEQHPGLSWRYA
jgi:hypothetical protein